MDVLRQTPYPRTSIRMVPMTNLNNPSVSNPDESYIVFLTLLTRQIPKKLQSRPFLGPYDCNPREQSPGISTVTCLKFHPSLPDSISVTFNESLGIVEMTVMRPW